MEQGSTPASPASARLGERALRVPRPWETHVTDAVERRRGSLRRSRAEAAPVPALPNELDVSAELTPDDPLLAHLTAVAAPVLLHDLDLDTPGVHRLRERGVHLLVPLVSAGELVGLVALGPPLRDDTYSRDARQLLQDLAGRAAPALRVGQLLSRERRRERLDRELELARLVQQQFLPQALPAVEGWELAAYYRPARVVGGDFYDALQLSDGRLSIVVGDVTDKGVPAALVMSSTHALLRAHAPRLRDPATLLGDVNDLLCRDIPNNMFVTCQVLVLEPASGDIQIANAGHTLPLLRRADGSVEEIRATGLPLGLIPGTAYDRIGAHLGPGDALLLHSDGVSEAHDSQRQMFGVDRLAALVGHGPVGKDLIDACLAELAEFTGSADEQEDDITLVTLARGDRPPSEPEEEEGIEVLLEAFASPSPPGNERRAMARVRALLETELDAAALDRLGTAVAETVMNAATHGNGGSSDVPVEVAVFRTPAGFRIDVTDSALTEHRIEPNAEEPDIDLKLAGLQSPRGWGLFLVRSMVDDVEERTSAGRHTVRLHVRVPVRTTPEEQPG